MGGLFGVISKQDCVSDLFYGTDYHSHLGTMRGGLAVSNSDGITRFIHDITNAQFRSKFETDILEMHGSKGIGVISDFEDQPLIISSHLGVYAIATVGVVNNAEELARNAFGNRATHFSEMSGGATNPTEIVATLIDQEATFEDGIRRVQEEVEGSCSLLLLTESGIYAARDKVGRTPVVVGEKKDGYAATLETCALPNLGYEVERYLGPGEIVLMTPDGVEQKGAPGERLHICGFLWVYYGYPASNYEGVSGVELRRDQRGSDEDAMRGGARQKGQRRDRLRCRDSGFGDGARHRLCQRSGHALQQAVRQIHPYVAEELYAAGSASEGTGREDETDSHHGTDRGQAAPFLRRFHCERYAVEGHDSAVVRLRGAGGAHASGMPSPGVWLQVLELLPVQV